MKKLLLSFIILILSYYPVHADRLSREESRNILLKGEVLGFKNFDSQDYLKGLLEDDNIIHLYIRDKNNLYKCALRIDTEADEGWDNDTGGLRDYYDHVIQCFDWNGDMRDQ